MKIAIIGGGMAGLGAAYKLSDDKAVQITVFEAAERFGGLSSTVKISGAELEPFYHHMFPNYFDLMAAAKKIGVGDKIFFRKAKSGTYWDKKIYPLDSALDLLRFQPLNIFQRLRTGFALAWIKSSKSPKKFEGVTAENWSRKYFGEKAFTILWEPLLKSKFGRFWKEVGMNWFWGRIYERPSKFGYFEGSLSTFTDSLVDYLRREHVELRSKTPILKLERDSAGGFMLTTSSGIEKFDQVIVAAAPSVLHKVAEGMLPQDFLAGLERYKYLGAICAIMVLKQSLTDYYWLNINDPGFPFLGIIEQSNFVPAKVYGGYHPVYLSKYLEAESDFYNLSDEKIWKEYIPAVKKVRPDFDEDWIVERHIFRAKLAQPLITADYADILPKYKTPLKGLWWVSMSHVYPWDRGIDHAFHSGQELANELLSGIIKK